MLREDDEQLDHFRESENDSMNGGRRKLQGNRSQGDCPNFRGTKGGLALTSSASAAKMGLSPSHAAENTASAAP